MVSDHRVQPGHPLEALGYPARGQDLTVSVEDAHVVVGLGPVDADEDHRSILLSIRRRSRRSRRANGPVLIGHATPAAISTVLTDHRGHALPLGLGVLRRTVLTRWPGSVTSLTTQAGRDPLALWGAAASTEVGLRG